MRKFIAISAFVLCMAFGAFAQGQPVPPKDEPPVIKPAPKPAPKPRPTPKKPDGAAWVGDIRSIKSETGISRVA